MSVYRPRNSSGKLATPYYHYDFQIKRRRFHGSTGCRKKSDAEEFEKRKKIDAAREVAAIQSHTGEPMSFDLAAGRFWMERGQHYKGNAGKTFKASIKWLLTHMPQGLRLIDINNSLVAGLVASRRGEGVCSATVNRTVTEPLRRILRYSNEAWDQAVPPIKWGKHLLVEPQERIRELKDDEERLVLAAMPEGYRDVVCFSLASGCRLAECIGLRWSDVDWGTREVSVFGKGSKRFTIPLTAEMRDLLFPLRAHDPNHVFTYPRRRARGLSRRGDRLPITYEGMKTAWRRAIKLSGVVNFRFHDNRHTAATRLLRSGSSLRHVQQLLRHSDIATTTKYAHVTVEDLRAAMEKASTNKTDSVVLPRMKEDRNAS